MPFMAAWAASATPSPPHRANSAPTARATPLPRSRLWLTVPLISSPTTGNWATAESTIRRPRSVWPWSANPMTVTATSSSGNSEKNP
jgi:hypothetical protein